jgi:hypothetical protein
MGTDEMYWPAEADEMTVGKYVATTVFSGVPAIGANLQDGPSSHAEITKAWLGFYHAHQPGLNRWNLPTDRRFCAAGSENRIG